jgi:hypothetical protein
MIHLSEAVCMIDQGRAAKPNLVLTVRVFVSKLLCRLARWMAPPVKILPYNPPPLSEHPWFDRDGNQIEPPPDCDEHPEKYGLGWAYPKSNPNLVT